MKNEEFNEVLNFLSSGIKKILMHINDDVKSDTYEIRLRAEKAVILYGNYGKVFVSSDGSVAHLFSRDVFCAGKSEISETVSRLCEYSVYAHQTDLAQGFITFGDGHRAGFCGTAVYDNGKVVALKKIESVNIRIARKVDFNVRLLMPELSENSFSGIIVAGAPCSGKTTFLRSFAKECSSTYASGYMKTVLIDERFEFGDNCGINCDVIKGMAKLQAIVHSTRVLSPELVVCDEICIKKEAEEILSCCRTGVKFAVSVHSDSLSSLFQRPLSASLLASGFFDHIVILDKNNINGNIGIFKTEDIKNEYCCSSPGTF